eukprot:gene10547-biopygen15344
MGHGSSANRGQRVDGWWGPLPLHIPRMPAHHTGTRREMAPRLGAAVCPPFFVAGVTKGVQRARGYFPFVPAGRPVSA